MPAHPSSSAPRRRRVWYRRRGTRIALAGAVMLALWQGAVALRLLPVFVLPPPLQVLDVLVKGFLLGPTSRGGYIYHLVGTLGSAMGGFAVGAVFAIALGAVLAEFPVLDKAVMPYFAALQGLPKIALAPLVLVWFGVGLRSQLILAGLVTYFPMLVNTVMGLKSADPEALELMRGLNASRWQTFAKLKFPASLPTILAGMQIAAVYSLLGAILAEYAGAERGIGVLILQMQSLLDTPAVFADLLILGVAGAVLSSIFRWLQRRVTFWARRTELGMVG